MISSGDQSHNLLNSITLKNPSAKIQKKVTRRKKLSKKARGKSQAEGKQGGNADEEENKNADEDGDDGPY